MLCCLSDVKPDMIEPNTRRWILEGYMVLRKCVVRKCSICINCIPQFMKWPQIPDWAVFSHDKLWVIAETDSIMSLGVFNPSPNLTQFPIWWSAFFLQINGTKLKHQFLADKIFSHFSSAWRESAAAPLLSHPFFLHFFFFFLPMLNTFIPPPEFLRQFLWRHCKFEMKTSISDI